MPAIPADRHWPGLPERDAARVAELTPACRTDGFGEDARKVLIAVTDRVRAEMRSGELTEALAVLHHLRAGLDSLHPSALVTRRGIGGLFDSRKRRLKNFRLRFAEATRTLSESLDDLQVRIGAMTRRSSVMDRLWADMRRAIVEADAFVAAAFTDAPTTEIGPGHSGHRLADARDAGLRVLPQVRVAQNADGLAAHRLKLACDAMLEWHHEWSAGLGVGPKRAKVSRPDNDRLATSRDTVLAMLDAATREVDVARQRRLEADARIEAARRAI
ncbi:hypothetical protein BH10PSE2_BH10PSE2_05000 [soil metagenome]